MPTRVVGAIRGFPPESARSTAPADRLARGRPTARMPPSSGGYGTTTVTSFVVPLNPKALAARTRT